MKENKIKNWLRSFFYKSNGQQADWYLIGLVTFLLFFGLAILSSASSVESYRVYGDTYWHLRHQLIYGVLPGVLFFVFFAFFDYQKLRKWAFPIFLLAIFLLVLVFIPGFGSTNNTFAKSWIHLFGFSFQPAEVAKLSFILYLSSWLASRDSDVIKDAKQGFFPFLFSLGVIGVLMIMQPDWGTLLIIVSIAIAIFFVAGGSLKHIFWLIICGIGVFSLLVSKSATTLKRLTTFLHPELDPKGMGYQINQALLAVGSGGWLGRGFGHSRQKFSYLPEVYGDSVYAIAAEELGFAFSVLIVLVFLLLFFRGLKIANNCEDKFGKYVAVGIATWLITQAFLNIGAIIGIFPLTGVPLPFISYGGTSLAVALAACGILVNISRQTNRY